MFSPLSHSRVHLPTRLNDVNPFYIHLSLHTSTDLDTGFKFTSFITSSIAWSTSVCFPNDSFTSAHSPSIDSVCFCNKSFTSLCNPLMTSPSFPMRDLCSSISTSNGSKRRQCLTGRKTSREFAQPVVLVRLPPNLQGVLCASSVFYSCKFKVSDLLVADGQFLLIAVFSN